MEQSLVEQEVFAIKITAEAVVVKNQEQYTVAGEHLRSVKSVHAHVNELFDPQIKKSHEAHRAAVALKNKFLDPLKNAEGQIKRVMLQFVEDQNARAREEQGRLQRVADERARREREALERRAEKAKTETKTEELEQRAAAVVAPQVHVEREQPKATGISTRSTWRAVVMNKALVPEQYKFVDISALNKLGNSTKGKAQVPGVEWKEEQTIAARQ